MTKVLNNVITQTVAIGTIAVVSIWPSPQQLRYALTSEPVTTIDVSDGLNREQITIRPAAYDTTIVEVVAPVPSGCIDHQATEVDALSGCAVELSRFISNNERQLEAQGRGGVLHDRTEQARLALAKICRLQWVTFYSNVTALDSDACNHIP